MEGKERDTLSRPGIYKPALKTGGGGVGGGVGGGEGGAGVANCCQTVRGNLIIAYTVLQIYNVYGEG